MFLTTCIERILDLGQIKVVVFFYSKNLFAKSIVTRSNKTEIISVTVHPTRLVQGLNESSVIRLTEKL